MDEGVTGGTGAGEWLPSAFGRACLLLLLREAPGHGYDLLERLRAFGLERDPGGLYRSLRAMEHQGLLRSRWEPSLIGPDRRRYELTPQGADWLDGVAPLLAEAQRAVTSFLARHQALAAVGDPGSGLVG